MTTPSVNFNDETISEMDFDVSVDGDIYPPENEFDELDDASVSTAEKRRIKKYIAALTDNGMVQITCRLPKSLGGKKARIPVYETSLTPNHRIRDAVTGELTPYKVGSYDENLFFKVCWATGEGGRQNPSNLFFGSPGEYEKHLFERVPERLRRDWGARRAEHIRQNEKRLGWRESKQAVFEDEVRDVVVVK